MPPYVGHSCASRQIAYGREVAAHTDQYGCLIKHAGGIPVSHQRYHHSAGQRRKAVGHAFHARAVLRCVCRV
jgi:hypothetical protein